MLCFFFFFFKILVMLTIVSGVCSFCSPVYFYLWPQNFFFLSFLSFFLGDSAPLSYDEADFESFGLDSLGQKKSLKHWVYTFKAVLLKRQWPERQRISKSWTMIVDLRPALASILTAFCTISSKFTDSQFCYSISTLIEGLRLSQK